MTLENLLRIGNLKEHPLDAAEIQQLLDAARRNLRDSRERKISTETRFDAAYADQQTVPPEKCRALIESTRRPETIISSISR